MQDRVVELRRVSSLFFQKLQYPPSYNSSYSVIRALYFYGIIPACLGDFAKLKPVYLHTVLRARLINESIDFFEDEFF
jgi:hypothetical protein